MRVPPSRDPSERTSFGMTIGAHCQRPGPNGGGPLVPSTRRPTRHTLDGRMKKALLALIVLAFVGCAGANPSRTRPRYLADVAVATTTTPVAENSFTVKLPPHRFV